MKGELMGFGGASAWLFVQEGARVVLGDIAVEDGERTAAQIRDEGGEALFVKLDVTSEEDWQAAASCTWPRTSLPMSRARSWSSTAV